MSALESMMMNPDEGPKTNTLAQELKATMGKTGTNFAFAVIVLLGQVGIGRAADNIEDQASEQRELAKGQGLLSGISQFLSLLEGNTTWATGKGAKSWAYWQNGFQDNNMSGLAGMVRSIDQLFWNGSSGMSGSWADKSSTVSQMNIFIDLPKAVGDLPKNTMVGFNASTGQITVNGKTPQPVPAQLQTMMSNIQSFFINGIKQMLGITSTEQAQQILSGDNPGHTVPRFLTILASQLQTSMDDTPSAALTSLEKPGSGLQDWYGPVMENPTISSLHGFYELLTSTTFDVDGSGYNMPSGSYSMASLMQMITEHHLYSKVAASKYSETKDSVNVLWDVLAHVMNDYESSKMSGTKADGSAGHNCQRLRGIGGEVTNLSNAGLFNEAQSAVQQSTSTLQSQTQQTAAGLQQESSVLTSYNQIGQSMITAVNKALQTMVQNLKSS